MEWKNILNVVTEPLYFLSNLSSAPHLGDPSIHYLYNLPIRVMGWNLSQLTLGKRQGTTWAGCQSTGELGDHSMLPTVKNVKVYAWIIYEQMISYISYRSYM